MRPEPLQGKTMIEIFWNLAGRAMRVGEPAGGCAEDVLAHPELARMDERQLADLPLSPAPGRLAASARADVALSRRGR
jgi:hypothetical protein